MSKWKKAILILCLCLSIAVSISSGTIAKYIKTRNLWMHRLPQSITGTKNMV